MRRASSENKYPVKSVVKALRILDVLAERPAGFGITELSEALQIGKSTVHRLLATLRAEGYVVMHPSSSHYILGGRIARLGQQLSDQYQLLTFGAPVIRRLAREHNETVNLVVLEGTEIVYIAGEESRETLRNHFLLGARAPAHATAVGKVCLSTLPVEEIRQRYQKVKLAPLGPKTIKTFSRLLEELSAVREAGFAYDDEESGPGIYCIAVPLRFFPGGLAVGISFSLPKSRITPTRRLLLRNALLQASAQISEQLGYSADNSGAPVRSSSR
jgi:IclR family transcriptional regulator, KDG regulon repressor